MEASTPPPDRTTRRESWSELEPKNARNVGCVEAKMRRLKCFVEVEGVGGVKRREKSDCLPLRLPVRIAQ